MTAPEKEQYDLKYLSETIDRLEEATKNNWIVLYRSHYFREETNESLMSGFLMEIPITKCRTYFTPVIYW